MALFGHLSHSPSATSIILLALLSVVECAWLSPESVQPLQSRSIASNNASLKILPVGASITLGWGSSDGNGYREDLREMLVQSGNNVSFVGSQFHGNMTNNACEAYYGNNISQVDDRMLESKVLTKYLPNVILINLGTNDCNRAGQNLTQAPIDMTTLLGHIKQYDPTTLVVLSSLLPNLDPTVNKCIVTLNAGLKNVSQHANATGQNIQFVDMYNIMPRSDINTTDDTHPIDAGYNIMAHVWYQGLTQAGSRIPLPDAKGAPAPLSSAALRLGIPMPFRYVGSLHRQVLSVASLSLQALSIGR